MIGPVGQRNNGVSSARAARAKSAVSADNRGQWAPPHSEPARAISSSQRGPSESLSDKQFRSYLLKEANRGASISRPVKMMSRNPAAGELEQQQPQPAPQQQTPNVITGSSGGGAASGATQTRISRGANLINTSQATGTSHTTTATSQTAADAPIGSQLRPAGAPPPPPQGNPIRYRMSQASDQLSQSLKQLYASASSISEQVHPPSYQNIPGIVPYYHGRTVGPPPSYDDVVNPYAPPPTYQSLFGQMREARKSSRGLLDLLRRLLIILVSTLGCTLLIAFMILIPFTMILVGAVYIDECHIEHIPAFLLVGGLVWASKNLIHCYGQCKRPEEAAALDADSLGDLFPGGATELNSASSASSTSSTHQAEAQQQRDEQQRRAGNFRLKSSICESLLNCVLFGWFIAGCVIIFRNYEPDFENAASARYCHRTVYMYTFWLITSALLLFGLFISCICCLMVSSVVANRQEVADLA